MATCNFCYRLLHPTYDHGLLEHQVCRDECKRRIDEGLCVRCRDKFVGESHFCGKCTDEFKYYDGPQDRS